MSGGAEVAEKWRAAFAAPQERGIDSGKGVCWWDK